MSREIKFRGKRVDNAEWVYGYLHVIDTCGNEYTGKAIQIQRGSSRPFSVQVESVTVGQYTGLKDSNRLEIYEGDILKCSIPVEIIDNGMHALDGETINAKVVYEDGCFMAEGKTVNYPWVLNGDKTILNWLIEMEAYGRYKPSIEVIGNIYENHDLLEFQS